MGQRRVKSFGQLRAAAFAPRRPKAKRGSLICGAPLYRNLIHPMKPHCRQQDIISGFLLIILCGLETSRRFDENPHPTLFGVNIILLNIPRHPKICHLTLLSFTNKNIPSRQVTMDYLKYKR